MNKLDFLAELAEMLQTDEDLALNSDLQNMEEWDSLAFMVLISFFDKNFGLRLTFEDLAKCGTPEDIIALSEGAIK